MQRYIAEEIATEHVDGALSRREALRRLALIGVGTAASGWIVACGGANGNEPRSTGATLEMDQQLRPVIPAADRFPAGSTLLSSFQAGHGWTQFSGRGSSGSVADDTSVTDDGSQSYAMTTSGFGNQTAIRSPAFSPTIDLAANSLVIKLRVDKWADVGGIFIFSSSDDSANMSATRAQVQIGEGGSGFAADGEFVWVNMNPGDWVIPGGFAAPNLTSITRLGVAIVDDSAGPLKVNVQQIWTRPPPTATGTVLAFDDGFMSQYTNVKPYLDKYGMRGVAFIIRDAIAPGVGTGQYMGTTELQGLYDRGWDLSAHADLAASHNSPNGLKDLSTTDGTATALSSFEDELAREKRWLVKNGWTRGADFFAWPQGKFDATRLAIARKYFTLIRVYRPTLGTQDADTYPFVDCGRLRQLGVFGMTSPDSVDAVNAALDSAWAAKKTVVLTFHNVIPGGGSRGVDYPLANFQLIIDHIAAGGHPVKTLSEVMNDGGIAAPGGASGAAGPTDATEPPPHR